MKFKIGNKVEIISTDCKWNGRCGSTRGSCIGESGYLEIIDDFEDNGKIYKVSFDSPLMGWCRFRENELKLFISKPPEVYGISKFMDIINQRK